MNKISAEHSDLNIEFVRNRTQRL